MLQSDNWVRLIGKVAQRPTQSTIHKERECYTTVLHMKRFSGVIDSAIIIASKEKMLKDDVREGHKVSITGKIQTYSKYGVDGKRHVTVYVWADEIQRVDDVTEDVDIVRLTGVLKSAPVVRYAKFSGKNVTDFILRVGTRPENYSFIPCVAWNNVAVTLSRSGQMETIRLKGRLQSRDYLKVSEKGEEEKVAYEVSIIGLIW